MLGKHVVAARDEDFPRSALHLESLPNFGLVNVNWPFNADENLDSKNGEAVMNLLADLHDEGATIVMVTHNPEFTTSPSASCI